MGHSKCMNRNAIVVVYLALVLCNQAALGQRRTGRIIAWGDNPGGAIFGYPTTGDAMGYVRAGDRELRDVVVIAAQGRREMALKENGTLVVWGLDDVSKGQLLTIPDGLSNVTTVALGTDHNLALKTDGTFVAWGYDPHPSHPAAVLPQHISNIVAVACAGWDTLAIKRDGTIEKWGPGPDGSPPIGLSNIVAIANGTSIGDDLALRGDGTVVEWPSYYVNDSYTMPPGLVWCYCDCLRRHFRLGAEKGRNGRRVGIPTVRFHESELWPDECAGWTEQRGGDCWRSGD